MTTEIPPTRQVVSLYACAWLIVHGEHPIEIVPGKTVAVVFADDQGQATRLLRQWYNEQCPVDARDFMAALNQARELVLGTKAATVPGGTG